MNKERYFVWKNYEALEDLVEGGVPSSTIVEKSITENGTYNASADEADGYSPVIVNVANSYTSEDEGKVVFSKELISQTATEITTNGTHDTTTNNSVDVNVPIPSTLDKGKCTPNFGIGTGISLSNLTWTGRVDIIPAMVWTDGDNYYMSNGDSGQYVFDKDTNTWSPKTWTFETATMVNSLTGQNIWSDGTDIYLSNMYSQYVLDKATSTWSTTAFTGDFSRPRGQDIWTDGTDYYISTGMANCKYNATDKSFNNVTFTGASPSGAQYIWSDGTNTYYSYNGDNYIFDGSTLTFTAVTFTGASVDGNQIVSDGTNIYGFTLMGAYKLDASTRTWSSVTFTDKPNPLSDNTVFFVIDDKIYYNDTYFKSLVINTSTNKFDIKTWSAVVTPDAGDIVKLQAGYFWSDGTNIYCSPGVTNGYDYLVDMNTYTLTPITFTGLSGVCAAQYIWTDGTNIYYSNGGTQKIFNPSTRTFADKTWTGLTSFNGQYVWTDGTNIYYSNSVNQYVLDTSTSTWSAKTWTGLTSFNGSNVWTDCYNIYYSQGSTQYVLDTSTSEWTAKTWTGVTNPNATSIFTDGTNIYLLASNHLRRLDVLTSTWIDLGSLPTGTFNYGIWSEGVYLYAYGCKINVTYDFKGIICVR